MPTEAVEKPTIEDVKGDDSGSGTESESDDSMPDLEEQDAAQQSRVSTVSRMKPYLYLLVTSNLDSMEPVASCAP